MNNQRKLWYAIGGVLILAFLAYGATSFKSNLTPYVSFEEAMRTHSRVQVAGALVENSSDYIDEDQELHFVIYDEGGVEMAVRYSGVKPANFEEATQIVAVGSWRGDVFDAENLLVKCPSKYQGVSEDPTKHGDEA
jgi:cytochrome c-type biogenesis protein CcmE